MARYQLNHSAFTIEDYTRTRPFASFLPGIAGLWGVPMWVFYVNRGQGIAGFGIQDKDHPIMEFLPANRAYRTVSLQGFRTFLKVTAGGRQTFYEPFQAPVVGSRSAPTQRMQIRMHDLELYERHEALKLETRVHYFTIPQSPFCALARTVTFTNVGRRPLAIELLDGLPALIPHGFLDRFLKNMSRTIEAWITIDNMDRRAPFYRLRVEPHDRPEVVPIRAGNFFVALTPEGNASRLLEPIIDPHVVFSYRDDCTTPDGFLSPSFRVPKRQIAADKTPCAMAHLRATLKPGESRALYALFGHMHSVGQLNESLDTIASPKFFAQKATQNAELIERLTQPIATTSGVRAFDLYCRQTFLDNLMRGGVPTTLGREGAPPGSPERKTFYVFLRKHGDLERDYNQFVVPASFFSQGNANYRDVNQNRRSDVWFYPEVADSNIITFFNLIQPDGFNPLVFKGIRYLAAADAKAIPELAAVLSKPFTPGELLDYITRHDVKLGEAPETFVNRIMAGARPVEDAEHGEGFWIDHWHYNLDLLDAYLALYPDRLRELLIDKRVFTFYDNAHVVAPRAEKYQLAHGVVRQFHAVRADKEKHELIRSRHDDAQRTRTRHGRGEVYRTTLLVKLIVLVANKLASLDPSGLGIEMEAEKPNWYDALNGLPGLLGSSLAETFELKRCLQFMERAVAQLQLDASTTFAVPDEAAVLIDAITRVFEQPAVEYWDATASAKERYREQVRLGFSGDERAWTVGELLAFLRGGLAKVTRGIAACFNTRSGLYPTYFYHEVTEYRRTPAPHSIVQPTKWRLHTLPPFLEGIVHALRQEQDPAKAKALYRAVRKSPLYDERLQMYRVCASLATETEEIGRCQIFTPGWLENQSVWLHMEYKYLLELLRCGLVDEFYDDFFQALIPFQPAKRYGRSILENSSFVVSSVYPDASLHGAGFVARLSGATAEFLQMWLWMTVGRWPFRMTERGEVELQLAPMLAGALFDTKGRFSFTLLGRTRVTYHNPRRCPTFGPRALRPGRTILTPRSGPPIELAHGIIPPPYAAQVRGGEITAIDVELVASTRSPKTSAARAKAAGDAR